MTSSHQDTPSCQWFSRLASALDPRSAPRLARLLLGAVLARGRRTVTAWIRAVGLSGQYQPCYTTVAAAGKQADHVSARLLNEAVKPLVADQPRITLALDDTPTQRYGPYVQGAGIHHNPTPGPAGSPHVYGHIWVVLGLLAAHPTWGVIALPLLARMYVRAIDLPGIDPKHRPEFRTKLELGVELLRWARTWLKYLGKPIWVVADGAYAKAPFLKPAMALGMTVVSRLRKDAALHTVPGPPASGRRGRPRIYGEGPHRAGRAGRAATRVEDRGLRALRQAGGEAIQDLRGDVAAGRRGDPGGAGGRAEWVGGLLLHRLGGERGRDPRDGGRPVRAGDDLPRLQGGRGGGPAAGTVRVGEHRCIAHLPLDVHDDRGLGVGPVGGRVGGPIGLAVGRPEPPAEPRGQASGVASRAAWRRRFMRLYTRGSPKRKSRPSPSGCSVWPHDSGADRGKYSIRYYRPEMMSEGTVITFQHNACGGYDSRMNIGIFFGDYFFTIPTNYVQ